ncbi:MAG: ParB/RepB/Spo0J family partition protein [Bacteroidota bacterium]
MKQNNQTTQVQTPDIKLSDISISPFNYRYGGKPVDEESLQELASSIKKHDVIQPVAVRTKPDGKYELVVGERRYRASLIAGKTTIPATIRELSDEQVKEIQVIENLQREDPHPMAEAMGIHQLLTMKEKKNSVADIAKRICKSESYVYQRLKLIELSDNFREMFYADKINITQALKLASLDTGSQEEFYTDHCEDWEKENFYLRNFNDLIEDFQLDLTRAPFDLKDAKLDRKAGACNRCPHNTAVITSLFPDESSDARCTNKPCYQNKCKLFAILNIGEVIKNNPSLPIAVPDDTVLTKYFGGNDTLIKGRTVLVEDVDFGYYEEMEDKPKREDYTDYEDDDENETEFQDALSEWETELQRMEDEASAGNYKKAILISDHDFGKIVYLEPVAEENGTETLTQSSSSISKTEFKAKDYQEAIKTKTLTLEMINGEKQRLNAREERSKELDEIKLQETFYNALKESEAAKSMDVAAGTNDRAVAIFLMYDSLGWYGKQELSKALLNKVKPEKGKGNEEDDDDDFGVSRMDDEELVQFFFNATENQISLLTRLALLNKSDAKSPNGLCGQMLRLMVECTPGLDAAEMISIQRTIMKGREVKLEEKIAVLDKQAEKLS